MSLPVAMHYFFYPEMENTFKCICNLVKRGGLFIFSSFTQEAFNPYAELFLKRLKVDYKIDFPSRHKELLTTKKQMEELATTSNPRKTKIEHLSISYPITVDKWWSLLNSGGFKGLLHQLTTEELKQFKHDHLNEIETIATDGCIELNADTMFGIVHL